MRSMLGPAFPVVGFPPDDPRQKLTLPQRENAVHYGA